MWQKANSNKMLNKNLENNVIKKISYEYGVFFPLVQVEKQGYITHRLQVQWMNFLCIKSQKNIIIDLALNVWENLWNNTTFYVSLFYILVLKLYVFLYSTFLNRILWN